MKKSSRYLGWTNRAAFVAATVCAATTLHAQTNTRYYGATFDGADTGTSATSTTGYNTYPNGTFTGAGTLPLAGQNGWASNDSAAGTEVAIPTSPNSYQTNGGTSSVGVFNSTFFGGTNSAILGGQYRAPGSTDITSPDVVPSAASGGVVNLFHAITLTPAAAQVVLEVDFEVAQSTSVAPGHDSFQLSLRSGGTATALGANVFTVGFTVPTVDTVTDPAVSHDDISLASGTGTLTATGSQIGLNTQYHLKLTLTTGANPTYTGVISQGAQNFGFNGNLTVDPATINQFAAGWTVTSQTITNGGYSGAGTNSIGFDNLTLAVPEPSTYAMMAVGLVGFAGLLRLRRRQA